MQVEIKNLSVVNKIIFVGFLLVVISLLDYLTGNEISFSIFYLLPIIFAGWFINIKSGILISVLSAILWFLSDYLNVHPYSNNLIPYWNAFVRLIFFISITYLLGRIKEEKEKEMEITQFVVHDLRSPLGNILSSLKLLSADDEEPPSENQKELIDLSISTGERMLIYINSLLDLGRLEAKKLPLNIDSVDVLEILMAAKEQVRQLSKEKNIEIKIDHNINKISADRNLLLRILVNLISNAIKVSKNGTEVAVSAARQHPNSVLLTVKDNGPGFSKKMETKLFEKYYQGSKVLVGSGIGLAFCKLAVEAHKGTISLDSIEGKGTIVSFIIPQ